MNSRSLCAFALVIGLLLPLAAIAQDKKDSTSVSITGCFNKGATADQYVIKDEKTGKETVVTGDTKLKSTAGCMEAKCRCLAPTGCRPPGSASFPSCHLSGSTAYCCYDCPQKQRLHRWGP